MTTKYFYNIYFDDADYLFVQIVMKKQMDTDKIKELIVKEILELYDLYDYENKSELVWDGINNACKKNNWSNDISGDDETAEKIEKECIKNKDFDIVIKASDYEHEF